MRTTNPKVMVFVTIGGLCALYGVWRDEPLAWVGVIVAIIAWVWFIIKSRKETVKITKLPLILLVLIGLLALPACYSISVTSADPGYPLHHDWGPSRVIEVGYANSCYFVPSNVGGRGNFCRVVDGVENYGVGCPRWSGEQCNWDVKATCEWHEIDIFGTQYCLPDPNEIVTTGSQWDTYGITVVTAGGEMYEGCRDYMADWTTKVFHCDYRIRKHVIMNTTQTDFWDHALHTFWPGYFDYLMNTLECASFITAVAYGATITLPGLWSCHDGPL